MSRDAVIVSTARTPIGKAYRGAFNATPSPTLAAHAIRAAVERSGVDPAEIDDVIIGAALQQGVQATIGRTAALRAGLPVTVAGMSIDRQCASGLMAIATAAKQVIVDRMPVCVAGGVESISMVQTAEMRLGADPELLAMHKDVYMPMIGTAEIVGRRYGISRERQDAYALQSQQRTAAAQAAGKFDDEIIPVTATMLVKDKATGETSKKEVTLTKDEGNRADTTLEGLQSLQPVVGPDGMITAGNASQLSDGASACVIMEAGLAAERGLKPLGRYIGMAAAGTEPDEMGIGPIYRGAETARPVRPHGRRYRPVGAERSLRRPGALHPGRARHPRRQDERRRRRHLDRPSLWHVGRADDRARPDRGQEARREICHGDDVRRRRHGRGGVVRSPVTGVETRRFSTCR